MAFGLAGVILLLTTASAQAGYEGQQKYFTTDCGACHFHGTQASLHTPAFNVLSGNSGFSAMFALTEDSNGVGAISVGTYRANGDNDINCNHDTNGQNFRFFTWKRYPSGASFCANYTGDISGQTKTYHVQRTTSGTCGSSTTCWAAWTGVNEKNGNEDLNFSGADRLIVDGLLEKTNYNANTVVRGDFDGAEPWERTADVHPNATTWTGIGSGAHCGVTGLFDVQAPPSPFTIKWDNGPTCH